MDSLKAASVDASGWHDAGGGGGSAEGEHISWLTIPNQEQSVLEDVQRIRPGTRRHSHLRLPTT